MRVLRSWLRGTRTAESAAMTLLLPHVPGSHGAALPRSGRSCSLPTGPHDYVEVYGADFDDERLCPSDAPLIRLRRGRPGRCAC